MAEHTIDLSDEELIELAVRKIDAVRGINGSRAYVYRDDGTRRYYRVYGSDLRDLGEMFARGQDDAYSLWCAETVAVEMPEGWEPSE